MRTRCYINTILVILLVTLFVFTVQVTSYSLQGNEVDNRKQEEKKLQQNKSISIELTSVPPYGSSEVLHGKVHGVNPSAYNVVVYIFMDGAGWWVKPSASQPLTSIASDSTWTCSIVSGGSDIYAIMINAYLIPVGSSPPIQFDEQQLLMISVASVDTFRYGKPFSFSGYEWWAKASASPVGPGANYFSDSSDNVWVDSLGQLHLKITLRDGRWQCPELISKKSFGYGKYIFHIGSRVGALDSNAVLGLFTWDNAPEETHREIDIEYSRWGNGQGLNAQYVVQPYDQTGHMYRWNMPTSMEISSGSISWEPDSINFLSYSGTGLLISQWRYEGAFIPHPGNEKVHMNLWLCNNGGIPVDTERVEAIITSFEFIPSSAIYSNEPVVSAPIPTALPDSVISVYSNTYTNVPVTTWSASWDMADVSDVQVTGNDMKKYTNLVYAGIEFTSPTINGLNTTYFHMDIWTPDTITSSSIYKVKLVDFGANGIYSGGDDVESELQFNTVTTPALVKRTWVGIDVPLSQFTALVTRGHLAQLIISGTLSTIFVDNIYFYNKTIETNEPLLPAEAPTIAGDSVLSLFSDAYSNVPVDSWSTSWDMADVSDVNIIDDHVKKYTNLTFAGIEFATYTIDVSTMNNFHMDVWIPENITAAKNLRVKLVDFGANGIYSGGDDVESEVTINSDVYPLLSGRNWVGIDIRLSEFTALTTKRHLAQLLIAGDFPTLYLDNVYFYIRPDSSPTTSQSVAYQSGWNLVSLPLSVQNYSKSVLFPSSISQAYLFTNGYIGEDTLTTARGYWLKFSEATSVSFTGYQRTTDSVSLTQGWNLIGSLSDSVNVSHITSTPPGLYLSQYFGYNNGYYTVTTLEPGKGFWVKVSHDGRLILQSGCDK
ncbi:MAG: hypothetical protein HY960_12545 [Ignavibacteriae bacterium]|nr:hypothetical protein [Ignavibacteriota bacterium]